MPNKMPKMSAMPPDKRFAYIADQVSTACLFDQPGIEALDERRNRTATSAGQGGPTSVDIRAARPAANPRYSGPDRQVLFECRLNRVQFSLRLQHVAEQAMRS